MLTEQSKKGGNLPATAPHSIISTYSEITISSTFSGLYRQDLELEIF